MEYSVEDEENNIESEQYNTDYEVENYNDEDGCRQLVYAVCDIPHGSLNL